MREGVGGIDLETEGLEVQKGLKFSVVESMICGKELAARLEGSSAREPKCIRLFNTKQSGIYT
jgi:hypothetical protein